MANKLFYINLNIVLYKSLIILHVTVHSFYEIYHEIFISQRTSSDRTLESQDTISI